MTDFARPESTLRSASLSLWIVSEPAADLMPDLSSLKDFSIRRFESMRELMQRVDTGSSAREVDGVLLVGASDIGRRVRLLREGLPKAAILVWSPKRARSEVAQSLAAGAQIYSTDTRVEVLAPRIRDAVARQQQATSLQHQAHRRLVALENERERLIALVRSVTHVLDRDLTALLGHLDQVFDFLPQGSPALEHLDMIDVVGSRASELAQELAAYTGSRRVVAEPFDVSELIEGMQALLGACVTPGSELLLNPGLNLPLVEADRSMIRRLIVDLTSLASREAPAATEVTLSTGARECDRELLREIVGGDGMRTGRFVYVEASVDRVDSEQDAAVVSSSFERSTGLEDILREHYGGLRRWVSPSGERISWQAYLPAFDRPAEDETPLAKGWHSGGTVHLIEPNELARASVVPTLERLGFDVLSAEDGDAALRHVESDNIYPVLTIIDAELTRPGTETVVSRLLDLDPQASVLISSGLGEAEIMPRFEGLGAKGFIRKPFRVVNLRRIFRQTLKLDEPCPAEEREEA